MNVLAFDTSTAILSTCLLKGKEIFLRESVRGLRHAETLLPTISGTLEEADVSPADLDLLVCARGPGSFTGLRIGMTTAKGLSEGAGVPVVSVDTLDILAWGFAYFDGAVLPLIDARKGRFYSALYYGGRRMTEQLDCASADVLSLVHYYDRVLLTGPGSVQLYETIHTEREGIFNVAGPLYASGYACAVLGNKRFSEAGPDTPDQGPVYIRKSDAELNRK